MPVDEWACECVADANWTFDPPPEPRFAASLKPFFDSIGQPETKPVPLGCDRLPLSCGSSDALQRIGSLCHKLPLSEPKVRGSHHAAAVTKSDSRHCSDGDGSSCQTI